MAIYFGLAWTIGSRATWWVVPTGAAGAGVLELAAYHVAAWRLTRRGRTA